MQTWYEVVYWEDMPSKVEPGETHFQTVEEAAQHVGRLSNYVIAVEDGSLRALNTNEEMAFWREYFRAHPRRA